MLFYSFQLKNEKEADSVVSDSSKTVSAMESKTGKKIVLLKLRQQIDPSARRMTNAAFELAKKENADALIIDMNTPGGLLNEADSIRTLILDSEIPVYVHINPNAASAGALISIACNKIYMSEGSTIGAATVVTQNAEALPDKYQSYMRGMMRSTAETRGRNPEIAEAMVDQDLELDSLAPKGKVLTLTRSEAIEVGYCDGKAESIDEVLKAEGYEDYTISEPKITYIDKIINFLIRPGVHGILILIIIGGIYYELQSPGIGFPIAASVIAAVLYFTPLYIEDLAANWEILIFVIGLILIGVELFVIPGFGIAGVTGLTLLIGGLVLAMIRNIGFDFTFTSGDEVGKALVTVMGAFVLGIVLIISTGGKLVQSRLFRRLVLSDALKPGNYRSSLTSDKLNETAPNMQGRTAITYTELHPSGKVMIDNELFNAITEGEYILKDVEVIVMEDTGNKLIVREKEEEE